MNNQQENRLSEQADGPNSGPAEGDVTRRYVDQRPLHNLPRGKNTWDPEFIKVWWFWPASVICIIILAYVYPYIWDFFSGL